MTVAMPRGTWREDLERHERTHGGVQIVLEPFQWTLMFCVKARGCGFPSFLSQLPDVYSDF